MDEQIDLVHSFGSAGETNLHPIVLTILVIFLLSLFFIKGRFALIFFTSIALLTPFGQLLMLGPIHLPIIRIMILALIAKIFISNEGYAIQLNRLDKLLIIYLIVGAIAYTLLWGQIGALINRMGNALVIGGIFFIFRYYLRSHEDIALLIKAQVIIASIIAICMMVEQFTGKNAFYIFGGVPEFTPLREGRLRSQASFGHPILAGCYGATLLPLIVSLWWQENSKKWFVILGIASAAIIVLASASSSPLLGLIGGIFTLSFWSFRKHLRKVRWGIVVTLITLQMVMKAPVWALISRVDIVGGNSADHRYRLIDNYIHHFGEWWFCGIQSTSHWGYLMHDTCLEYVDQGVRGGVFTFALFIAIMVYSFKWVGRSISIEKGNLLLQKQIWAYGCAMFAHLTVYFGISYFDQTIIDYYILIAIIASVYDISTQTHFVSSIVL